MDGITFVLKFTGKVLWMLMMAMVQISVFAVAKMAEVFTGPVPKANLQGKLTAKDVASSVARGTNSISDYTGGPREVASQGFPETVFVAPPAQFDVADRVKRSPCFYKGLHVGHIWVYLYHSRGVGRPVLKLTDKQLIQMVGWSKYYFDDLPFKPDMDTSLLMADATKIVGEKLVAASKARSKAGKDVPAPTVKVAAPAPVEPPKAQRMDASVAAKPAPQLQPQASLTVRSEQMAVPFKAGSFTGDGKSRFNESRRGRIVVGTLMEAGYIQKNGKDGSYESFRVLIDDGERQVSLYGKELETEFTARQVRLGDQVRVVDMGREPIDIPGKKSAYRNLYAVEKLGAQK